MYLITYNGSGLGCAIAPILGSADDIKPKSNQVLVSRAQIPNGSIEFMYIENGELKWDMASQVAESQKENKAKLENACRSYQDSKIPSNDFTLYNVYKTPKALECIQWVDELWALYFTAKAAADWDFDFSVHGEPPHSFIEVRSESGE